MTPEEERAIMEKVWQWERDGDWRKLDDDPVFAQICARALTRQREDAEKMERERELRKLGLLPPIDPLVTSEGWPNLHAISLVFTAFAFLAFFLMPPKIGGTLVACAVIWWLFILPLIVILTGGKMWDPARTGEAATDRRDP